MTSTLASQVYRAVGPSTAESTLFEKLDRAISNAPPRAGDVVQAFGLDDDCAGNGCFFKGGDIGGIKYASGNLRPTKEGLIFVLEDFSGQCVRVDQAEVHYGTRKPEEGCDHGGCWYRSAQYEWGIIGFGVKDPKAQCVSSLVINTEQYQRPKSHQ